MGHIKKQGSIGSLSGTVNDVILSEWNGIPVVRSRAKESSKPATSGQLEQQAKMATAVKFAVAVKKVFAAGFQEIAANDKAILVVYCEALDKCLFSNEPGNKFFANFHEHYIIKRLASTNRYINFRLTLVHYTLIGKNDTVMYPKCTPIDFFGLFDRWNLNLSIFDLNGSCAFVSNLVTKN